MIYESDRVFVVFSNPRLMPGHLLVIPKHHAEKLSEFTQEDKTELFQVVEKYEEKILKNVATGCDIRQNYRPFIVQGRTKVNHMHFHLMPREFEDSFYQEVMKYERAVFKDLTEAEMEEYKMLLEK